MSGMVGAATTTGVIVSVSDDGKSDFIEVKQEDLSAAPVGGGSSTNQGVVGNSGAAEDQEEEGNLMIVDDADGESDDDDENGDVSDVALDKLPRPVNELNCRQSRTFLVKLLRAANGGLNPQYGNPEMRPAFWPDYYWPWTSLTDVHTKPRGMHEPLQYSEMMKLAIARGYQYFGYDPETYWDINAEVPEETGLGAQVTGQPSNGTGTGSATGASNTVGGSQQVGSQPGGTATTTAINTVGGKDPPKLPRPLVQINCVQARTCLSRLLRYQQGGNNPNYGSAETEPPWWPNELIKWTDMVDLRGKPPYLPPTHNYTEVMKMAIEKAFKYYGVDPNTHVDPALLSEPGMSRKHTPKSQHHAPPPALPTAAVGSVVPGQVVGQTTTGPLMYVPPTPAPRIFTTNQPNAIVLQAATPSEPIILMQHPQPTIGNGGKNVENIAAVEEDESDEATSNLASNEAAGNADEEAGEDNLPPRLPLPIGKLNCSATRTALAKLIRFHCGNQLPNYGNPASMPSWWPNHLINWSQIKNLSHKYDGYLGNTYSNCLRIAVIRGYAHYGLDANEWVGTQQARKGGDEISIETDTDLGAGDVVSLEGTPVTAEPPPGLVPANNPTMTAGVIPTVVRTIAQLPTVPVPPPTISAVTVTAVPTTRVRETSVVESKDPARQNYPLAKLQISNWFPPTLTPLTGVSCSRPDILRSLKKSKVVMQKVLTDRNGLAVMWPERYGLARWSNARRLMAFASRDMKAGKKFTDFSLYPASAKGGLGDPIRVHKVILAAQSAKMSAVLESGSVESECLVFPDFDKDCLELIVKAMYTGEVLLESRSQLKRFNTALRLAQSLGLLRKLRPALNLRQQDDDVTLVDSFQLEDEDFLYDSDDESSLPSNNEEPTIVGKPGPKSKKLARKSGKKIKANFIDDDDVTQSLADIIEREEKKMQAEEKEIYTRGILETVRRSSRAKKKTEKAVANEENSSPAKSSPPGVSKAGSKGLTAQEVSDDEDEPISSTRGIRKKTPVKAEKASNSTDLNKKSNDLNKLISEEYKTSNNIAGDENGAKEQPQSRKPSGEKTLQETSPHIKIAAESQTKPINPNEKSPEKKTTEDSSEEEVDSPKATRKKSISKPEADAAEAKPEVRVSPRKRLATESASPEKGSPDKSAATASGASPEKKARVRQEANRPNFKAATEQAMNDKVSRGSMEFIRWLMRLGFLSRDAPECNRCTSGSRVILTKQGDSEVEVDKLVALDGVAWTCSGCNAATSVREGSIFGRAPSDTSSAGDSLCWIMRLVLCWSDNTSLSECQQATGADVDKIFLWYDLCRAYFGSQER